MTATNDKESALICPISGKHFREYIVYSNTNINKIFLKIAITSMSKNASLNNANF